MAKDETKKDEQAKALDKPSDLAATQTGTAPVHVTIQQTQPKAPDPTPNMDVTVPGGRYFVRRGNSDKLVQVDAHGEPFTGDQQDEEVLEKNRAKDRDISKIKAEIGADR